MAYNSFTIEEIKEKFGVEPDYQTNIFSQLPVREASDWLKETLNKSFDFALSQGSEKARSEYLIAPVFLELREQSKNTISVFSGSLFNVDRKLKLDGYCDFLVSRSPFQSAIEAPVIVAVEAKRQDFEKGIAQCIAEMIAARIFNERKGKPVEEIYGCVTTGDVWRFLVLRENMAIIETKTFDLSSEIDQILGVLWTMTFDEVSNGVKRKHRTTHSSKQKRV